MNGRHLLGLPILLNLCLSAPLHATASGDRPLLLTLYAEKNARGFGDAVEFSEHCCCPTDLVSLWLTNIRDVPVDVASGEAILEVDAAGAVLNEWVLPVDGTPDAIEGDEIYSQAWLAGVRAEPGGEAQSSLVVSLSGHVSVRPSPSRAPDPRHVECPPVPRFEGSAYLRCAEFEDLATGSKRLLAYQGPCT